MILGKRRTAFSLVEVMVVIAILAVLASLLLAGVLGGWESARRLEALGEIVELERAVALFKHERGVDHLPSRLKLARKAGQSDDDTRAFLSQLFRHPQFMKTWETVGIVWNSDAGDGPVDLQGDQCLVFLLVGAQVGGQPIGFDYDGPNPAVGGKKYFSFKAGRLRTRANQVYLSYYDSWNQTPFAYFSSGPGGHAYRDDCAALGVRPYGRPGAFLNPTSYQIISAGPDGVFGDQGSAWTPVTGPTVYPPGTKGRDDQANFQGNRSLGR